MSADLENEVRSWFLRRAADVDAPPGTAPTTSALLDAMIRQRSSHSRREISVREDAMRVRELPVPPQDLIDWVGGGDAHIFQTVGMLNTLQLLIYCRLQPWHHVLEPGCGCGRNARYIAPYLDAARGRYEGFDIHARGITWASETITTLYANVRFAFADIENSHYNPNGSVRSSEYVFPYEDDAFDLVFLPSVFTHLTRDGFEQYAREIQRVLKPDGLLLSWHFLLNDRSLEAIRTKHALIQFEEYDRVSRVMQLDNPCTAIAFDESYVLDLLERTGLRPQFVAHGGWPGGAAEGLVDAQDRILAVNRG